MDTHQHHRSKRRSRSPSHEHNRTSTVKRHRSSRSPRRHQHATSHDRPSTAPRLPLGARHLHKGDLDEYTPLFAEYLDLQKQIDFYDLSEHEAKGRWKSFRGKWNAGELAEGWYDGETKKRADARAMEELKGEQQRERTVGEAQRGRKLLEEVEDKGEEEEDDDDGFGPNLPSFHGGQRRGPTIPNHQDLQHRRELAEEDHIARRADLRYERKQDREEQKARLEELVPRAEPGSRERQLEKRRDATAVTREFRDAKDAGEQEVGDTELMGGEDGVDAYKAHLRTQERQKNEREIRKEEVLRARAAEREERLRLHRVKEDKTMEMLKALAQQRFGGGGNDSG